MKVPTINVHEVHKRLADLRDKRANNLRGRSFEALSDSEKSIATNIDAQIGYCTEQLREHQAGAGPRVSITPDASILDFDVQHESEDDPSQKKIVSRMLQSIFRDATSEQREEIHSFAGYLRGRSIEASSPLSPTADGVLVPLFIQSTIERIYTSFHPVVDVCRLFPTETGAPTVYPVLDDTESAEQLDEAASTGADSTVSGDTPPTSLSGPTLKSYKISSKPVYIARELSTDTDLDIVSEVLGALIARIVRFENERFTLGTGVNQAEGFLHACSTFEGTGTLDLDGAQDLAYAVGPLFRPNGTYMMSDGTAKFLRKIKTGLSGDKRTIWTDYNQREGTPATLHGYPVKINNAMADVASDGTYGGGLSSVLAFGDFSRFVVRQAELNRAYLYRYLVPARDGAAVILFRRTDSKLLATNAIAKLSVGGS